tara:strand:+ start:3468 stop:5246 length:1779 start_codon:yes stop_codon:yes gene_type:complete
MPQPNSPIVSAVSGEATDAVNRAVAAGNTERSLKAQKEAQQAAAESREKQQLLQLQQTKELAERKMSFDREQAATSNQLTRDQMAQSQQQFSQQMALRKDQADQAKKQNELARASQAYELELKALEKKREVQRGKLTREQAKRESELREQKTDSEAQAAILGIAIGSTETDLKEKMEFVRERALEDQTELGDQIERGAQVGRVIANDLALDPEANLEGINRNNVRGGENLLFIFNDTDIISQRNNLLEYAYNLGVRNIKTKDGEFMDINKGLAVKNVELGVASLGFSELGESFSAQSILESPEFQEAHEAEVMRDLKTSVMKSFRTMAGSDFNADAMKAALDTLAANGTVQDVTELVRLSGVSEVAFAAALNELGDGLRERSTDLAAQSSGFGGEAERSGFMMGLDLETDSADVDIAKGPQQRFLAEQYRDVASSLTQYGTSLQNQRLDDQRAMMKAIDKIERGLESQNLLTLDIPSLVGSDKDLATTIRESPILSRLDPDEISELQDLLGNARESFVSGLDLDQGPPEFTTLRGLRDSAAETDLDVARQRAVIEGLPAELDQLLLGVDDAPAVQAQQTNVDARLNALRSLF